MAWRQPQPSVPRHRRHTAWSLVQSRRAQYMGKMTTGRCSTWPISSMRGRCLASYRNGTGMASLPGADSTVATSSSTRCLIFEAGSIICGVEHSRQAGVRDHPCSDCMSPYLVLQGLLVVQGALHCAACRGPKGKGPMQCILVPFCAYLAPVRLLCPLLLCLLQQAAGWQAWRLQDVCTSQRWQGHWQRPIRRLLRRRR